MDADHDELPISTADGTTSVMALFIKGVDNRATLTMNWSSFFHKANMKKGCTYAFTFKCTSKGLCMIVYPI
uniref:TF-B3 domain-containing protein n=1 Tax=Aegilops tauschii TaxID=37682 RepID=M8C6X9_AEGTA